MMTERPRRHSRDVADAAAAGQAEHDQMARNRIGKGLMLKPKGEEPVETHGADAFRRHRLENEVATCRAAQQAAQAALSATRGGAPAKRARRALNAAQAKLKEAQLALRADIHCEPLAPAVRRQDIVQGGVVLRETQVTVRGQRVEVTPALERLHARGSITLPEYRAAVRYREAYEKAGRDLYPIGLGGDGGRSAPASGNRRVEEAIASSLEIQKARKGIGLFATAMLDHIVVEGLTLASWAEKKGQSEHVGRGVLTAVLQRLIEVWSGFDRGE